MARRGPDLSGLHLDLTEEQRSLAFRWKGLCFALARDFERTNGLPHGDLFADAWSAQCKAAGKFRPELGNQFSTYAHRVVVRMLARAVIKINRQRSRETVEYRIRNDDRATFDPDPTTLEDIADLMVDCTPLEVAAMWMRANGKTMKQCGQLLGVSRDRVRSMLQRAEEKVRNRLDN